MPDKGRSYDPLDLNPITLVEEMVMERLEQIDEIVDETLLQIPVGLPLSQGEMADLADQGMDEQEAISILETKGYTGLSDTRRRRAQAWLKQNTAQ